LLKRLLEKTAQCYATIWGMGVSHGSELTKIRWGGNECTLHISIILAICMPKIII